MIIYTDGSANPNPGKGGFGVVVLDNQENIINTYNKQYSYTTNNEMELKAILYTLIKYGTKDSFNCPIVYSDSAYAINCITKWMFSWAANNWTKSNNQAPENLEIIQAFYTLYNLGYRIELKKVKGHSNNIWNEMADKLAKGENI